MFSRFLNFFSIFISFNAQRILKNSSTILEIQTDPSKADGTILLQINKSLSQQEFCEEKQIEREMKENYLKYETAERVLKMAKDLKMVAERELSKSIEKRERIQNRKKCIIGIPVMVIKEKNKKC